MSHEANTASPRSAFSLLEAFRHRLRSISPRRREILVGLLAPVLLTGALLTGEIVLRFEQWRAFGANQVVETQIDETIWEMDGDRRRPRANAKMGRIQYNAQGFRGDLMAMPKPSGVIRIGFLGSSTTLDIYVGDIAKTWPAVAVSRLQSAYPNCKFDFFNAAVPGYNVRVATQRLTEDTAKFEPDIVVFLVNDLTQRGRLQLTARGIPTEGYTPGWLAQHSILWLKVEKNAVAQHLRRVAMRQDLANRIDFGVLKSGLSRDLATLIASAKKQNTLPILVENAPILRREQPIEMQADHATNRLLYLPRVYVEDITEFSYWYNGVLREAAAGGNVPFIPTIGMMPAKLAYYADASHTTVEGSSVFGLIVGDRLSSDSAVLELLKKRGSGCAG